MNVSVENLYMEKTRIISVDVLRGLTIMMMTIVNNPGDWAHIFPPFEHAVWHGWTPTDLVFPFFLFIVGISVVLSNPERTLDWEKLITRTLRIFLLGMALAFFSRIKIGELSGLGLLTIRLIYTAVMTVLLLGNYSFKKQYYVAIGLFILTIILCFGDFKSFEHVRIPGVLQRISLVFFVISLLYHFFSSRLLAAFGVFFLLLYWVLMTQIPVPGFGEANVEVGKNLAAWLDQYVLPGHLWATSKTWDPEGILSTIPALSTGISGIFAGKILMYSQLRKSMYLILIGLVCIVIGLCWDPFFPINKSLWTSSFVLLSSGFAFLFIGILHEIIEQRNINKWTSMFVIFGVNPMLVFFFSGIIPRALNMIKIPIAGDPEQFELGLISYVYRQGIQPYFNDLRWASLAGAFVYLLIWFAILYLFNRKNIIFKV
jgi:predicted acyltransferase